MTTIDKIRAEIERRKNKAETMRERAAYLDLLSFLDTLSEEPDNEDLEKAAMNYIAPIENEDGLKVINFSGQDIKDAFIAGAEWQKEQMMKEAVEGEVENGSFGIVYLRKNLVNEGYSTGDKVKIIIVKEDGE